MLAALAALAALAGWFAVYPLDRWVAGVLLGLYGLTVALRPALWLVLMPALWPVVDLAPWSGHIHLTESDALALTTLAALGLREALAPPPTTLAGRAPVKLTVSALALFGLLAASVLISLSLYQRMSRQVTEVVQEESQNLIAQVGRSVESYLRTIMKLSDSLYYGTIKNADLSSQSLGSEFTLLYDNNKDNVENIALFSEDGALLEAVPAVRLKNEVDVTQEEWFRSALNRTENQHFSLPHVQYVFDNAENQYRWVISLSRVVELTHGTSTSQGVLLVDIRYSSLEQLFGGIGEA